MDQRMNWSMGWEVDVLLGLGIIGSMGWKSIDRRVRETMDLLVRESMVQCVVEQWIGKSLALLVRVLMDQWVGESMDQLVGKSMHLLVRESLDQIVRKSMDWRIRCVC